MEQSRTRVGCRLIDPFAAFLPARGRVAVLAGFRAEAFHNRARQTDSELLPRTLLEIRVSEGSEAQIRNQHIPNPEIGFLFSKLEMAWDSPLPQTRVAKSCLSRSAFMTYSKLSGTDGENKRLAKQGAEQ
jgi:hypothetical protein